VKIQARIQITFWDFKNLVTLKLHLHNGESPGGHSLSRPFWELLDSAD
jgi:hypothetical protein